MNIKLRLLMLVSGLLISSAAYAVRPSDQAYILLTRAVTPSITYSADVWISNPSSDVVAVTATLIPYNASPVPLTMRNVLRVPPGITLERIDFLGSDMKQGNAIGLVVFDGCLDGADCRGNAAAAKANYRSIGVHARIYSFATNGNGGTIGQDFDAWPWYDYGDATHPLTLTGIRASDKYRTNVGIVNASQYSTITLQLSLYDGASGGLRAQVPRFTLLPTETRQQNVLDLFPAFRAWANANPGKASTDAVVTITQLSVIPTPDAAATECADGCPAFFAYGSLVDSNTNDATTLRAEMLTPLSDAQIASQYGTPLPSSSVGVRLQAKTAAVIVETPEQCMARVMGPRSRMMTDVLSEAIRVCSGA